MALSHRETCSVSLAGKYDEEMRDVAPATQIEVPSFVAEADNQTLHFLKELHNRMDNVVQRDSLKEDDRL